ncbi:MAG: sulfite exporter TauE/SafE family protein [Bacteroidota bacterium]|nr:sulfite exporter TauE/SafE family protein [Bacteroidota bacterium]
MISLFITAFVIGGLGSVHCVGMCGPLALSLPVVGSSVSSKFTATLLYNSGRIVTYAALGALFGMVGKTFALFGYQQGLSVVLGTVILIFLVIPKQSNLFNKANIFVSFFYQLRASLGKLFARKNYQSVFFIGLLNGLLPCGLVYMAIAGAVATASVGNSSLFMAAFGLGTLPMMWSVSFFGSFINIKARQKIRAAYPYMMFIMACLLILRGLGLGIPYISPANFTAMHSAVECHN